MNTLYIYKSYPLRFSLRNWRILQLVAITSRLSSMIFQQSKKSRSLIMLYRLLFSYQLSKSCYLNLFHSWHKNFFYFINNTSAIEAVTFCSGKHRKWWRNFNSSFKDFSSQGDNMLIQFIHSVLVKYSVEILKVNSPLDLSGKVTFCIFNICSICEPLMFFELNESLWTSIIFQ